MNHFYQNIQGWFNHENLYRDIVQTLPNKSHIVEIGCWKGTSTAFLAVEIINSGKNVMLDCIDTWEGSEEHNLTTKDQYEELYLTFIKNLMPVRNIVFPIKTSSLKASKLYDDNSLDFVFIDAAHDYENVKQDIIHWYPKVKNGGILAGHDYISECTGVVTAVDEFFSNNNLKVEIRNYSWVHYKQ